MLSAFVETLEIKKASFENKNTLHIQTEFKNNAPLHILHLNSLMLVIALDVTALYLRL